MKKKIILKYFLQLFLIGILFIFYNCENQIDSAEKFEEYVFGVQLAEDSLLVEKYIEYHKNVWPEVEQGFRKAGYDQIRLFRFGNYIIMIVKVPEGSDLARMGQVCNDSHPRVGKWNNLMNTFQKGLPGTAKDQTWVEMNKMYEYKNDM